MRSPSRRLPVKVTCALLESSNVVRCGLGTIPSGKSATVGATAIPTLPGKITDYAAARRENLTLASAKVLIVSGNATAH